MIISCYQFKDNDDKSEIRIIKIAVNAGSDAEENALYIGGDASYIALGQGGYLNKFNAAGMEINFKQKLDYLLTQKI